MLHFIMLICVIQYTLSLVHSFMRLCFWLWRHSISHRSLKTRFWGQVVEPLKQGRWNRWPSAWNHALEVHTSPPPHAAPVGMAGFIIATALVNTQRVTRNPNTILALSYTHRLLFPLGLLCHVKCNWPKNNLIFSPWILRNPQSTQICHRSSNVCSPLGENPGFPYVSPAAVNCQAFYLPPWSSRLFTFKLPGLEMHLTWTLIWKL